MKYDAPQYTWKNYLLLAGFLAIALFYLVAGGKGRIASLTEDEIAFVRSNLGYSADQKLVVALVADWCGACRAAETYMNSQNIRYTRINVDDRSQSPEVRRLIESKVKTGIPKILVQDTIYEGFSPRIFANL